MVTVKVIYKYIKNEEEQQKYDWHIQLACESTPWAFYFAEIF